MSRPGREEEQGVDTVDGSSWNRKQEEEGGEGDEEVGLVGEVGCEIVDATEKTKRQTGKGGGDDVLSRGESV